MNNRTNCPKNEAGKARLYVFGAMTIYDGFVTLQGAVTDPNYCMVNEDGDCIKHNPVAPARREADND